LSCELRCKLLHHDVLRSVSISVIFGFEGLLGFYLFLGLITQ
jgi:hypothetical protein